MELVLPFLTKFTEIYSILDSNNRMSSGHVLAHVEDAPRVESSERPTVSRNRERIGYAIGVLGLIVSGLIIYAFGNKVFRLRKLTAEEKLKPGYERILSFLPGKYTENTLKYYFILFSFHFTEMHFMAYCFWLFAVYSASKLYFMNSFTVFFSFVDTFFKNFEIV